MGMFEGFKNLFGKGTQGRSTNEQLQHVKRLIEHGDLVQAKELLTQIIEVEPSCLEGLSLLGNTLGKLMEFDGAVSAYKKALDLAPDRSALHGRLAAVYHEMGSLDDAVKEYGRAIELNPKDGLSYMNLGALFFNEGKIDGAVANYKKALELLPKEPIIHSNLGKLYVGQGLFDKAIVEFQKSLKIDEHDPITYCEMGTAYYYKGEVVEAIITLKHAISIGPEYPDPHYILGMIYEAQNNPREASRFYLKYLNLEPKGIFVGDATSALKRMGRSV